MAAIHRIGKVTLYVYAGDHPPPHFHLKGPNTQAQVEIGTLRLLRGHAPRGILNAFRSWAEENRPLLMQTWVELNERGR